MISFLSRTMVLIALVAPVSAASQEDAKQGLPLAKIVEVTQGDGAVTREFFGRVSAKETVDLAFQVGGQIVNLPIIEGEPVEKGKVVAELDTEPFQIALDQARAQRDQALRTLDRLSRLSGNTVSQVTVDDTQTQADLAEIAVREAQRNLNNATLTAPFDALVARRNVANFATVGAGASIVRLHDMSELHIDINVPEVLFQRAGNNPDVTIAAVFPGIDEAFPLEVREFNAETSDVGQTFGLTFAMAPPEDHIILPGSSVTVFATLGGQQSGISIPPSSVVSAPDGTSQVMIFVSDADNPDIGEVKRVDISIAPSDRGEILVTDGLDPGTQIVATGAYALRDGDRIRRFTGFAN